MTASARSLLTASGKKSRSGGNSLLRVHVTFPRRRIRVGVKCGAFRPLLVQVFGQVFVAPLAHDVGIVSCLSPRSQKRGKQPSVGQSNSPGVHNDTALVARP